MFKNIKTASQLKKEKLEQIIVQKVEEIKKYYENLSQTYKYGDHTYQIDKESELKLATSLTMAELGIRESPSPWRTLDNVMVDYTNEEFKEFCSKVFQYKHKLFLSRTSHVDAVRGLTSVSSVTNYKYDFVE